MAQTNYSILHKKTVKFLRSKKHFFINNQWVSPIHNTYFPATNPADGEVLSEIPLADRYDVDKAVEAAQVAFENQWIKTSPEKKARLIWQLSDLMERDKQVLMELETLDNGKPLDKAEYDVDSAIKHFKYYAGWATKLEGSTFPITQHSLVYTKREPLGVAALIVPWNFPLMIATWKLAPALACGNCCVLKPSEKTSLSTLYLGTLIQESGFPEGVVNIITGGGIPTGSSLVTHPSVNKISFTGSTKVGKQINGLNAHHNLKNISLELGGKSPNVIFSDADLEAVGNSLHWSSFYNSGQECTLGSRIYIQKPIFDQVVEQLKNQSQKLTIGNGLDNPDLGPLIDRQHLDKVLKYIDMGVKDGGELILGGEKLNIESLNKGNFLGPTIFIHDDDSLPIVQDEIFGPVVVVSSFDSFEQVIDRSNSSNFGLTSAVWTKSHSTALKFVDAINAGTVWINGYDQFNPAVPFGGFKDSGIGKEMGKNAIEEYTREKAVWFNY